MQRDYWHCPHGIHTMVLPVQNGLSFGTITRVAAFHSGLAAAKTLHFKGKLRTSAEGFQASGGV